MQWKVKSFLMGCFVAGIAWTAGAESGDQAESPAVRHRIPKLPDGLEFGALVEVDVSHERTRSGNDSDLTLATVELSAGWQAHEWVRGDLVFLYEEDETEPMELDQAFITLGSPERCPVWFQFGRLYVPFGHFDSFFITDPVVLELAETRATAGVVGLEQGGFQAAVAGFRSGVETDGGGGLNNMVLSASYELDVDPVVLTFGVGWIRNIMDSFGLTDALEEEGYRYTSRNTGGFNAWVTAQTGPLTWIAEYVEVLNDVRVDGERTGLKPRSLNLELGYELTDRLTLALKTETSRHTGGWFARNRYGAAANWLLYENDNVEVGLGLEYLREDFGAGEEDADRVTLQLAFEF